MFLIFNSFFIFKVMLAPTYEDYIDRLNEIPEQAIAMLNQIRKLDK